MNRFTVRFVALDDRGRAREMHVQDARHLLGAELLGEGGEAGEVGEEQRHLAPLAAEGEALRIRHHVVDHFGRHVQGEGPANLAAAPALDEERDAAERDVQRRNAQHRREHGKPGLRVREERVVERPDRGHGAEADERAHRGPPAAHRPGARREHDAEQHEIPPDRRGPDRVGLDQRLEDVRVNLDTRREPAREHRERGAEEVALGHARLDVRFQVAPDEHDLVAEGVGRQHRVGLERLVEGNVRKRVVGADVTDHRALGRLGHAEQAGLPLVDPRDDRAPEDIVSIRHRADRAIRVGMHDREPVGRAGRLQLRKRIDAHPETRQLRFLVAHVGSEHDVAASRDGLRERGDVVGRGLVGEHHVEGDDHGARLRQLVDQFPVEAARPRPLVVHLPEGCLVDADDGDGQARVLRRRRHGERVEALQLHVLPQRDERERGEDHRDSRRDRGDELRGQRAAALQHEPFPPGGPVSSDSSRLYRKRPRIPS